MKLKGKRWKKERKELDNQREGKEMIVKERKKSEGKKEK